MTSVAWPRLPRQVAMAAGGTIILSFVTSLLLSLETTLESREALSRFSSENTYWTIAQAQIEHMHLVTELYRFAAMEPDGSLDRIKERNDLLWSRMVLYEEGILPRFLVDIGEHGAVVRDLAALVRELDQDIQALGPDSRSEAGRIAERLWRLARPLRLAGAAVREHESSVILGLVTNGIDNNYKLIIAELLQLTIGITLIGVMVRAVWRGQRLLAEATDARIDAHRANERLIEALEVMSDGFALFDDEDRLVLCNAKYRAVCAPIADLLAPGTRFADIARIVADRGRFQEAGVGVDAWIADRVGSRRDDAVRREIHLDDGRWILAHDRPTREGGTVTLLTDITTIREREVEVQASRRILAEAERIAGLASWEWDVGRESLSCSDGFAALLGWPTGLDGAAILDRAPWLQAVITRCRGQVAAAAAEHRHAHPERGERTLVISAEPILEGDRFDRVVGTVQDVTAQRDAEASLVAAKDAAERASRTKSEFLAMMSHEIRTPLNGVIGTIGLMADTVLDDHQRHLVTTARSSGESLLAILNDILDFSKMEAGKLRLEPSAFDLRTLVTGVTDLLVPLAAGKGLDLSCTVNSDVPGCVAGDAGRLRQVLLNLLNNAVKFTVRGHVRLRVSTAPGGGERGASGDGVLRFEVEDTGIGIPAGRQSEVFSEFNQIDRSYTRRFGGTGLGLAISHRLVTMMGGCIGFRSEVGVGSVFWLECPLPVAAMPADAAQGMARQEDQWREMQAILSRRPRILVAEDNPTNQLVIRHQLEKLGCQVDVVSDGREAVDAAARPYDVILMDIQMPELDGLEAARLIRGLGAASSRVPILALTANAMPDEVARFVAAGMDGCLTKPVALERLAETLLAVMAHEAARPDPDQTPTSALAGTDEPLLDNETLGMLVNDLDPATLRAVTHSFFSDAERRLTRLADAATAADLGRIGFEAHSLISSAETFGLMRLSGLCREAQTYAKKGDGKLAIEFARMVLDAAPASLEALAGHAEMAGQVDATV